MPLRISRLAAFVALLLVGFGSAERASAESGPTYTLTPYAKGYSHPIRFVTAPGAEGPSYVVEQEGKVTPLTPDTKAREPYLDLSTELIGGTGEGGLLDFAFHPKFAENGLVVVSYTGKSRTPEFRVSEFSASKSGVDTNTERKLLRTMIQEYTHLGGALAFGPEDRLFIGVGDASGPSDPQDRGQSRGDIFGAILRIGTERPSTGKQEYETPKDNPLIKNELGNHDIWAYGFRDPRTLTFDPVTKTLWAGDAGVGLEQEIDDVKPGGNYGWAVYDGKQCLRMRFECLDKAYASPVVAYGKELGSAIVIGPVYQGDKFPALKGMLLYADSRTGKVWGLKREGNAVKENPLLVSSGLSLSAIGVDAKGAIYVADYEKGEILELSSGAAPATAAAPKATVGSPH